ncbi:hypothetical protein F6W69_10470 [Microbacterium oxydans]|uniref:hypothetical protein n=1 Tax=Microbacterium oxydans TaxID=82380 RepID=UPI001142392C|nr:hypothetical protein [Microbacterium oxydans]KAB1891015.1 hypothetical protein F6W69_10470 [Microbacterium oxydans]GED39132.1 hypothetical protein MOX01_22740 [Microbacterium oxydans]
MAQFSSSLYPQTNPTNPILLDMRDYYEARMLPVGVVANAFLVNWRSLFVVESASTSQRHHARRVLTRLAAFSG